MPALPRRGTLDIAEDVSFQEADWRVQRVGWAGMAFVLLAALAGFLGGGPLSRASQATSDGALAVEYGRFERRASPTRLTVRFAGEVVRGDEARIWFDRRYAESMRIEHVAPPPQRVEIGADRLTFVFRTEGAARQGAATFHFSFDAFGRIAARVGGGGAQLAFRQIVYP